MLGRVVSVSLPLLGPARFLKKFPEHLRFDSSPIIVNAVQVSERQFRMEFRTGVGLSPYFLRGLLEEALADDARHPHHPGDARLADQFRSAHHLVVLGLVCPGSILPERVPWRASDPLTNEG